MNIVPAPKGKSNGRSQEVAALLVAARAVLEIRDFDAAARAVLEACRTILGAGAGVVALRATGGAFQIAVLAPDSVALDSGAGLEAPLDSLASRVVEGSTVFDNALGASPPEAPTAGGRPAFRNALVTPILIAGNVAGVFGLLDKSGDFSTDDARLAEVFAEMTAVALLESRTVDELEHGRQSLERKVGAAERKFQALVENLPDVIARYDPELRHLYVSPAAERVTGRPAEGYLGKTNQEAGMPAELVEAWDSALRRVFASGRPERFELSMPAPDGTRRLACRLIPEPAAGGAVPSVLSIARDVTDEWRAHEAERRALEIAEALREATVALARSLDREAVLATLLDRLRGMVPFDRALVMLLEEASRLSIRAVFDGDRVVPLRATERTEFDPSDHPVVHGILTSGKPVLIPDLRAHPEWSLPTDRTAEASWMGVPLFARGDVAGLFSLSKREPGYFNAEHVRLAEALSTQASVAVENAILFEQMQAATLRMQSLSRRLVEAQETERRNIARELHDEAGQALTSLRFGLRQLEREIGSGAADVGGRVADLVGRTDTVIEGLHRLAADLRPPSLDHVGLEAALRQYVRRVGAGAGLEVRFKARGLTGKRLPMEIETTLYRVVQEAMANVVRHARATRIDVLLDHRGERVAVMVEDDGVGFDREAPLGAEHFGLLGMKERAEALSGSLTLESVPGAGTTVVVEVPSADPHRDR